MNRSNSIASYAARIGATLALLALAACGGGGSSTPTPTPTPVGSSLTGKFYGPLNAQVGLQNNNADTLTVTVAQSGPTATPYDVKPFTFATPAADGTAYSVTLTSTPVGQTCAEYSGYSGVLPVATGTVHVGCEFTYDLVSVDGNGPMRAYGGGGSSIPAAIGGANLPIGSGATQSYGEGRFVAYVSPTPTASAPTGYRQIYLRDRLKGTTTLVSADANGNEGNSDSFSPAISADGLTVAFESVATNLVPNDTNAVSDIFVWSNRGATPTISRVSVDAGGAEWLRESDHVSVSGDGSVVAFETILSNVTKSPSNDTTVVRLDLKTGVMTPISVDHTPTSTQGTIRTGHRPVISEDGTKIAFWAYDTLLPIQTPGLWDIYLYDSSTNSLQLVSFTSTGVNRDQGTDSASGLTPPAISGDGHWVAYSTTATNVVPGDTNAKADVFLVDMLNFTVQRVSVATDGTQANGDSPASGERVALNYDGTWVAFNSYATNIGATTPVSYTPIYMHNRVTGETRAVTNEDGTGSGYRGGGGDPAMSRDGGYVLFQSSDTNDLRYPGPGDSDTAYFTGLTRAFSWGTN